MLDFGSDAKSVKLTTGQSTVRRPKVNVKELLSLQINYLNAVVRGPVCPTLRNFI